MRMTEIIELPPRDEYNEQFIYHFEHVESVARLGSYTLKRNDEGELYYGLFDNNKLIAYLHISDGKVSMVSVDREYRGQGYATYLMDYAVLKDKLSIASDTRQTPETKILWLSLIRNGRYDIVLSTTGEQANETDTKKIWNGNEDIYLIAKERQLSPNEQDRLNEQIERRERAGRKEYLYGPGTSSELFWNP